MPPKPLSDEGMLSRITGALPVGRVRPGTLEECESREAMFRPDAVLALTRPVGADIGAFEQHVASLVDGVRPVARIRSKSGVSSDDLRIALGSLCDQGLLRLVGIVIEASDAPRPTMQVGPDGSTDPGARPDIIPTHVMADIHAMLAELDEDDDP